MYIYKTCSLRSSFLCWFSLSKLNEALKPNEGKRSRNHKAESNDGDLSTRIWISHWSPSFCARRSVFEKFLAWSRTPFTRWLRKVACRKQTTAGDRTVFMRQGLHGNTRPAPVRRVKQRLHGNTRPAPVRWVRQGVHGNIHPAPVRRVTPLYQCSMCSRAPLYQCSVFACTTVSMLYVFACTTVSVLYVFACTTVSVLYVFACTTVSVLYVFAFTTVSVLYVFACTTVSVLYVFVCATVSVLYVFVCATVSVLPRT